MSPPTKRSRMIFVAAAAVAIALLVVLAGHLATRPAAGLGQSGSENPGAIGVADAGTTSSDAVSDALAVDPAKQEPALDKFHSKDPFTPLVPTPGASASPSPSPSSSGTAEVPTGADITINDKPYTVSKGDKVPPGSPAFVIADITGSGVTFDLLNGRMFDDGSTSVVVPVGQLVTARVAGKTYDLFVVRLIYGTTGGGGGGGGTTQGHSIKVLSISSQNGTASATFNVDGVTYADKQVGDTFSTDWGQIKVVAIDFDAQTVTILHGDETLTLHAGQAVVK